nr:hypothetical protein [Tanacetum cinerariifolium]
MTEDDNHDGDQPETSNPSPLVPPPIQQISHSILSIKLPILKKEEYDIWAIKIEYYLSHTDYLIWKVIQNGNGPIFVTTYTNEMIKVLPPKTAEEGFSVSALEGLHKGDDRFKTLSSQLEIHDAGVLHEDANHKFLRSLPSSWSQVALIMRTKPRVSSPSILKSLKEGSLSYTDEVIHSFFVNQSIAPQLDYDDLEQNNDDDMKEMDLKWQVAMISMRIKKFHKRTGRKLHFDTKDPVGFDKTKVKCFNCHKIRHFAIDYRAKGNQDSRRRDVGYNGNKARDNGRRPAYQDDSKALVTIDGEDIDWSAHVEEDA